MNFTFNKTCLFFVLICYAAALNAAGSAMVVKQDGKKVYLDITELEESVNQGDQFRIVIPGEEIINPKTGKSLGRTQDKTINGHITLTEELYAVGILDQQDEVMGMEAEVNTRHQEKPAIQTAQIPGDAKIMPLWQSTPLNIKARAVAAGDITGDGENELVLVNGKNNNLIFYALKNGVLEQKDSLKINPLRRVMALDAADLKGTGKAQIFATVYDGAAERFLTLVIELENGALTQTGSFPGVTKGIAPDNGPRVLYTQDILFTAGRAAATTPALLTYKDGSFTKGTRLKAYKFDSIFGFNASDFKNDGKTNVIYTTPSEKLRVQFDKIASYIESPSDIDFGITPNKTAYKTTEKKIYPSLGLFKKDNDIIIAAAENNPADNTARLYYLKWTGNSLAKQSVAQIPGLIYDIFQAPLGSYKNVIIAPFTSTDGTSTVLLFPAY